MESGRTRSRGHTCLQGSPGAVIGQVLSGEMERVGAQERLSPTRAVTPRHGRAARASRSDNAPCHLGG